MSSEANVVLREDEKESMKVLDVAKVCVNCIHKTERMIFIFSRFQKNIIIIFVWISVLFSYKIRLY